MAEMMGPFDPASPCLTTFCKRISKEDFEKQASDYTQDALAELLQYLEYNPTAYHNILRKRKREDAESGGIFSYLKAKMLTTMFGDEYLERLDQKEAKQKMAKLKDDIRSSYDYAEGEVYLSSVKLATFSAHFLLEAIKKLKAKIQKHSKNTGRLSLE